MKAKTWKLLSGALPVVAFVALEVLERGYALRRRREPGGHRLLRNLGVAGVSSVVLQLAGRPVLMPLTERVDARNLGLLPALGLPRWAERVGTVLLLDYLFYGWHVALHRVPLLWRAHAVHHVDLDLDTSTALRFHFGEFLASVPVMAAGVRLIGARPGAFTLWQTLMALEVMFHHSNLRLPLGFERALSRVLITPRLHGIHHSEVSRETDSNYSSGLTLWDFLHGTHRANVPQGEITVGLPAYQDPREVTLPQMLALPFRRPRREHKHRPAGEQPDASRYTLLP
ncbi:MAG: sterol desaturase family protein [Catalinimonas sp.]